MNTKHLVSTWGSVFCCMFMLWMCMFTFTAVTDHEDRMAKREKRRQFGSELTEKLKKSVLDLADAEVKLRSLIDARGDEQQMLDLVYKLHRAGANMNVTSSLLGGSSTGCALDFAEAEKVMRDTIPLVGDDKAKRWVLHYADTMKVRRMMGLAMWQAGQGNIKILLDPNDNWTVKTKKGNVISLETWWEQQKNPTR